VRARRVRKMKGGEMVGRRIVRREVRGANREGVVDGWMKMGVNVFSAVVKCRATNVVQI